MTRRMQHYDVAEWKPWLMIAGLGSVLILAGIACQVLQLVVSIRDREALRDLTGDPWDGRSLEWATASPPPVFNFAILPDVTGEEAYWVMKRHAREAGALKEADYRPIEMPRNSPTGFVCAFFATVMGFAMIWHIWWMACLGVFGAFVTLLVFAFRRRGGIEVPAEQIARLDQAYQAGAAA